jgi:hypothetical protein
MSRRWRAQTALGETEVPYGPREPVPPAAHVVDKEPVG